MSDYQPKPRSLRISSPNIENGHSADLSMEAPVNVLSWDHSLQLEFKKQLMNERHKRAEEGVRDLQAILAKKEEIKNAEIDTVTGLPTRAVFERDLQASYGRESLNQEPRLVLSILDLNGLKRVNEHLGHIEGGDKYLRAAADAVKSTLRPGDTLYRIGGDELATLRRDAPNDLDELNNRVKMTVKDDAALKSVGIPAELYSGSVSIGSQRLEVDQSIDDLLIGSDYSLHEDKVAFNATIPREVLAQDSRLI